MNELAKVFGEAVKQALKFFQSPGGSSQIAKHAEKVMKAATKIAKNAK